MSKRISLAVLLPLGFLLAAPLAAGELGALNAHEARMQCKGEPEISYRAWPRGNIELDWVRITDGRYRAEVEGGYFDFNHMSGWLSLVGDGQTIYFVGGAWPVRVELDVEEPSFKSGTWHLGASIARFKEDGRYWRECSLNPPLRLYLVIP